MIKYVLCVAGGVALGYFIAQDKWERKYFERLGEAEAEARDFYQREYVKKAAEEGEYEGVTEAAVSAAEAFREYSGITVGPAILTQEMEATVARAMERGELDGDPDDDGVVRENIISDADAFDAEIRLKVAKRKREDARKAAEESNPLTDVRVKGLPLVKKATEPKVQYHKISKPAKTEEPVAVEVPEVSEPDDNLDVIEKAAFIEDQFGYKQFSLTYFAGDDVLANESDDAVEPDARKDVMNDDILTRLNSGEKVIYVRNNERGLEVEITLSTGAHSHEVNADNTG
jgi:hypothetical protein